MTRRRSFVVVVDKEVYHEMMIVIETISQSVSVFLEYIEMYLFSVSADATLHD